MAEKIITCNPKYPLEISVGYNNVRPVIQQLGAISNTTTLYNYKLMVQMSKHLKRFQSTSLKDIPQLIQVCSYVDTIIVMTYLSFIHIYIIYRSLCTSGYQIVKWS